MTDKISEWKAAKELCEKVEHLNQQEKLEFISQSDVSDSIKEKAVNLIKKMSQNFDLIESGHIDKILPDSQQNIDLSGKCIADYKLLKLLGSGGMSSVYLAKRSHSEIQKKVALKILSPYATTEKHLELFNREQKSLAQLNHKNIVSFHHGGHTDDGTRFLVMDYVEDGQDIVSYCNENALDLRSKIELVKNIAEAISYAHEKNIIHRDLKSAYILIDANDEIKIVDFGIAVFAEDNDSENSTRVFTYDIASPEQIQGEKVDGRTDIFSLGALLLQLLTGKTPTPSDIKVNKYNPELVRKHISNILKQSNLNSDLRNIIYNAMHIDVDQRYGNMRLFTNDLHNFLNFQPISAAKDSVIYRLRKFLQRNPLTSFLVTIVFLVSVSSVWIIFNNNKQRQKAEEKTARTMTLIDTVFEQADPFNPKDLVASLESIEQKQKELIDTDPEFSFHFYQNMANIYNQNAKYHEALKAKQNSIKALEKYTNSNDMLVIENKIDELSLLHATGNYSDAVHQSQDLLKQLETQKDIKPITKLKVYLPLSRSYAGLSQLDEELKIHKKAMAHMDANPDIDAGFVADMLGSMAISQYRNGNKEMTTQLFDKTIETYKSMPIRRKNLAATMRNYAAVNVNYGNFEKAEQLFKESIDIIKSVDPKHPTLASTYMRYASLLSKTWRLDQAENILLTAIEILTEVNDQVELTIAYTYLAELHLRKNDINSASDSIIHAKQQSLNPKDIDHPKTLKIYILALWILMLEPYNQQALQLLNYMDAKALTKSKNSKEYAIYQVQKALLTQNAVSNQQSLSVLTQYLFGENRKDQTEKISWLQQQLNESSEYDEIVKAFLNIWLIQMKFDEKLYQQNCQKPEKWQDDAALSLKFNLMKECSIIAKNNNLKPYKNIQNALNSIQNQTNDTLLVNDMIEVLVK